MFSAVTKQGERVILHPASHTGISGSPPYHCPVCNEEVVLKKGKVRRWHFAHRHHSLCRAAPESEEHLEGKAVLYEWLERQNVSPRLEVFLPDLGRQADILFTWNGGTYAVEYQCASIPPEEAVQRTNDYLSHHIQPLWIYSSDRLRFDRSQRYSIHAFEWTGLREEQAGTRCSALTYLSPAGGRFSFLYPRASLSSAITYADLYTVELSSMSVSGLIQLPSVVQGERTWMQTWLNTKKQWRYSRSRWHLYPDSRYVRVLFADRRSDIPYFPAEAGWPVEGMTHFNTPPHHWQSAVLLSFLDPLPLYTSFSLQTAAAEFCPVAEDILRLKQSPLVNHPVDKALEQYFRLLEKTPLLQKNGDGWKKVNGVYLPASIDEGYKMDKQYFSLLF
ncbi:competence protein CoiA [Salibacterium lacus]|uniref:Competence protein CoiA n=1 Tax=Salibacterium lacus TaxID=1898109 RepID=A0ABW5SZ96_9BACI